MNILTEIITVFTQVCSVCIVERPDGLIQALGEFRLRLRKVRAGVDSRKIEFQDEVLSRFYFSFVDVLLYIEILE